MFSTKLVLKQLVYPVELLVHDPGIFDSMKVSHWAAGAWLRSPQLEGGVRGRVGWTLDTRVRQWRK